MTRSTISRSRRHGTLSASIVAVAALTLTACGGGDGGGSTAPAAPQPAAPGAPATQAPEFTLTVVNFNGPTFGETSALEWLLSEIETRSGGRVAFERFHGGSLCEGPEIVDCVMDGRADIGMSIPGYTPSNFPIAEIQTLPFLSVNGEASTQAYQRLIEEFPAVKAETDRLGLKVLGYTLADRALIGSATPIESIDDLVGKRMRSVGLGSVTAQEAVGGNPVSIPANDIYEAMQRGVIDIWTNNIVGLLSINFYEVSDYVYDPGFGLYIAGGATWMNQSVFDSLPADIQTIIDEATADWLAFGAYQSYSENYFATCAAFFEDDARQLVVWEKWPETEVARWRDALGDTAVETWVASAAERGVENPREVYETYVRYLREAETNSTFVSAVEDCMERHASMR